MQRTSASSDNRQIGSLQIKSGYRGKLSWKRVRSALVVGLLSLPLGLSAPFGVATAWAACEASGDACAPKKEPGTWDSSLAFGYNLTSGNSETTLLSILAGAKRETSEDIIDLGAQYFFGTDDNQSEDPNTGEESSTTRNDVRAQGSYKYLLSDGMFLSASTNFLYDEIAEIDYRFGATPSFGYFLAKNPDASFFLEVGPGYLAQRIGGESESFLAPRIADGFEWIISCTSKIYQKADIVFDVNDSSNYIVTGELGVEAALNAKLALVLAAREIYNNEPAPDRKRGDFLLTTALKVSL